jgi:hypothetical protein
MHNLCRVVQQFLVSCAGQKRCRNEELVTEALLEELIADDS